MKNDLKNFFTIHFKHVRDYYLTCSYPVVLALYLCQVQVISVFADRYLHCKTVNWARADVAEGQQRVWWRDLPGANQWLPVDFESRSSLGSESHVLKKLHLTSIAPVNLTRRFYSGSFPAIETFCFFVINFIIGTRKVCNKTL